MSQISLIVAISDNNAIGKNNQLLWHLPADLKHFKQITSCHTIIMGRKTYDSIGKPLPNRRNIVVSRNTDLLIKGVELFDSLEAAIKACISEVEIFIIGGAEIYRQSLPIADKIYLTRVHRKYEADTFFPVLDEQVWNETDSVRYEIDENNKIPYTISTLTKSTARSLGNA